MINKTIDSFFKKTSSQIAEANLNIEHSTHNEGTSTREPKNPPFTLPRTESTKFDTTDLVRDPGLRPSIWEYTPSQCDEI